MAIRAPEGANNRASIARCPITETSWKRQLDCNVDTSVIYYSHDCDEGR